MKIDILVIFRVYRAICRGVLEQTAPPPLLEEKPCRAPVTYSIAPNRGGGGKNVTQKGTSYRENGVVSIFSIITWHHMSGPSLVSLFSCYRLLHNNRDGIRNMVALLE